MPRGRERETPPRPLVIGLGNEDRGDDGFGRIVARRLRPRLDGIGTVVEQEVGGAELLEVWGGQDRVWVVDAVRGGGDPGTVYRIEVGPAGLPSPLSATSSHGISLAQAIALGQVLHRLPSRLVIHGVEPAGFETGRGLSSVADLAVETVARRIEGEVRAGPEGGRPGPPRGNDLA